MDQVHPVSQGSRVLGQWAGSGCLALTLRTSLLQGRRERGPLL